MSFYFQYFVYVFFFCLKEVARDDWIFDRNEFCNSQLKQKNIININDTFKCPTLETLGYGILGYA